MPLKEIIKETKKQLIKSVAINSDQWTGSQEIFKIEKDIEEVIATSIKEALEEIKLEKRENLELSETFDPIEAISNAVSHGYNLATQDFEELKDKLINN